MGEKVSRGVRIWNVNFLIGGMCREYTDVSCLFSLSHLKVQGVSCGWSYKIHKQSSWTWGCWQLLKMGVSWFDHILVQWVYTGITTTFKLRECRYGEGSEVWWQLWKQQQDAFGWGHLQTIPQGIISSSQYLNPGCRWDCYSYFRSFPTCDAIGMGMGGIPQV